VAGGCSVEGRIWVAQGGGEQRDGVEMVGGEVNTTKEKQWVVRERMGRHGGGMGVRGGAVWVVD